MFICVGSVSTRFPDPLEPADPEIGGGEGEGCKGSKFPPIVPQPYAVGLKWNVLVKYGVSIRMCTTVSPSLQLTADPLILSPMFLVKPIFMRLHDNYYELHLQPL